MCSFSFPFKAVNPFSTLEYENDDDIAPSKVELTPLSRITLYFPLAIDSPPAARPSIRPARYNSSSALCPLPSHLTPQRNHPSIGRFDSNRSAQEDTDALNRISLQPWPSWHAVNLPNNHLPSELAEDNQAAVATDTNERGHLERPELAANRAIHTGLR